MSRRRTIEQRFWPNVEVKATDECWRWKGSIKTNGYGQIWWRDTSMTTHRVAWILQFGEIPDGLDVCHTCDNTWCVNPHHLWLGTAHDNLMDMASKGRHWRQKWTHCPRGHAFDEDNTMIVNNGRRRCRACHLARARKSKMKRKEQS